MYGGIANSIISENKNIDSLVVAIDSIEFDSIWSSVASESLLTKLSNLLVKVDSCSSDLDRYSNVLYMVDEYIEKKEELRELETQLAGLSYDEDDKDADVIAALIASLTNKISKLRIKLDSLKQTINSNLGSFSGVVASDISISQGTSGVTGINSGMNRPAINPVNTVNLEVTNPNYDKTVLTPRQGRNRNGPQGYETWYDLNMNTVVKRMGTQYGIPIEAWIDKNTGLKMCKKIGEDTEYVMVAADAASVWGKDTIYYEDAPFRMGDVVMTSWGPGMVVDVYGWARTHRELGTGYELGAAWDSGYISQGQAAADLHNSKISATL